MEKMTHRQKHFYDWIYLCQESNKSLIVNAQGA